MRTRQRPPVLINRGHLLTRFRDRHIRLRRTGNALDIAHGSATATWRHVAQTLDAQHDAVGVSHFHGGRRRRRRRVLLGRAGAVHAGDARERGLLHSLTPLHARRRPRCILERAERRRAQLMWLVFVLAAAAAAAPPAPFSTRLSTDVVIGPQASLRLYL